MTLARPHKRNALDNAMYGGLADGLERAESDPAVRVVLIRGEGDMFTAGNDIADFAAGTDEDRHVHRFLDRLVTATCPIVAAVQGRAVGVGTTMLLHCDAVIVAEDALLSTPFVNLALVPEAASSLLMTARIGHVRAFQMFALGEGIDGRTAVAWGLANRCVPATELWDTAQQLAARLAAQPAGALRATKWLMRPADEALTRMAAENAEFSARLGSPEAKEAFAAFAERRKPDFRRLDAVAA